MRERTRIAVLIGIMSIIAVGGVSISMHILYQAAFVEEKERLRETVQSRARIIESVARYDLAEFTRRHSVEDPEQSAFEATLTQIRQAHNRFEGFGSTGEFTLARRDGEQIVFLLSHRHFDREALEPVAFASPFAEPMRRALNGESGTLVGLDYRGAVVLAAHEPVGVHGLGIVAKIDLAEVRAPFIRAGILSILFASVFIVLGTVLFLRIGNPIITKLEQEIDEHTRVRRRLLASEARFRGIFESDMVGIVFWGANGEIDDANDTFLEMVGYTRVDLNEGRIDWKRMTPEEHLPKDEAALAEIASYGRCRPFEKEYFRKDGSRLPIIIGAATLPGATDRGVGFIVDRTEFRVVEEAKKASEASLHLMVSKVKDYAIFMLDREGRVASWNVGAQSIKGYEQEEIIGRHFSTFYLPEDVAAGKPARELEIAERAGKYEEEGVRVRKDGSTFTANVIITALRDDRGEVVGFSKVTRDITEIRKLEEQFRQSQKMEAIGRLAGGVAHDFNNLLTVITIYCDLVSGRLGVDDPMRDDMEEIRHAADRATEFTRQLLAFSSKQIIQPRIIDINSSVSKSEKMLQRIIGEDIELVFTPEADLWVTRFDPGQAEQILINLAVNARDAMLQGGRLTVETANVLVDSNFRQKHPETDPGRYVMLAVTDTGNGMDEHTRTRVFDPFFTTKSAGEGSGLGLSTVYGIIKQHGGSVHVDSELGHGTSFKIYLPATEGRPEAPIARRSGVLERGDETILLIEDDPSVRGVALQILQEQGFSVIEAANGDEALNRCRNHQGSIDLVLTDVVMPGMSGKECFERLSVIRPGLEVVYMSGYAEDAIAHRGVLEDGTRFLQKPFTVKTLLLTIRDALEEH
jgi:two-component system, cell cycle sensor histidine kinase and response regulator CckA